MKRSRIRMARTPLLIVLAAVFACPAAADDMGRLFLSPEDRQRLDVERRSIPQTDSNSVTQSTASSDDKRRADDPIPIGLIQRSDGRRYLWKKDAFVAATDDSLAEFLDSTVAIKEEQTDAQSGSKVAESQDE